MNPNGDNLEEVARQIGEYQKRKTIAQGMIDLALLSANANQLRFVWAKKGDYFYLSASCIIGSIVLQILIGIMLLLNTRYEGNSAAGCQSEADMKKARRVNNITVVGIFIVTVMNIFIHSFSIGMDLNLNI